MSNIDNASVASMRANIVALKDIVPMGATDSQLRLAVVMLRDVQQNFVKVWKYARLPGIPRIPAITHILRETPRDAFIVYFGAMERPQPTAGLLVPAFIRDGKELLHSAGLTAFIQTTGEGFEVDPWERRKLSTAEFFEGLVLFTHGVSVTRNDVIQYQAYRKGAIHSHASQYHADYPQQMRALDQLRSMPPMHARANDDYLLLSVARDFVEAPDVDAFLAAT